MITVETVEERINFVKGIEKEFKLKSIKSFATPDGSNLRANIYHNGKLVGEAFDYGNGGGVDLSWTNDEAKTRFSRLVQDLPPTKSELFDKGFKYDEGCIIDELVNMAEYRRWTKNSLVYKLKSDSSVFRKINLHGRETEFLINVIKQENGDNIEIILNEVL